MFMAPATGICSVLRASHREERSNVANLIPLRCACGGEFILLRVSIKKHAIKRAWHPVASNFALGEYTHALRLTSELVLTRRRIVAPYRLDKLGSGRSLLWAFRREKQSFRLFFSCHFGLGMRTQFQGYALEQFHCEDAINKEPTAKGDVLSGETI